MGYEMDDWFHSGDLHAQELRAAFADAVERLQRDEEERDEPETISAKEHRDAVWGRLTVQARRGLSRRRFDQVFDALHMELEDNAIETRAAHLRPDERYQSPGSE